MLVVVLREWVLPLLLASAVVLAVAATTDVTRLGGGWDSDGRYYGAMAGAADLDPDLAEVAPWTYRILTPAVVEALPLPALEGFRAVAIASGALALVLVADVLRTLGYPGRLQLVGVVLYGGVFWSVRFNVYSPGYVDAVSQAFLLGFLALLLRRRTTLAMALLCLGAVQKESLAAFVVVAAVAHLVESRRTGGRVSPWSVAGLVAPPLLVVAAVRLWRTPAGGGDGPLEVLRPFATELERLVEPTSWPVLGAEAFAGLGMLGPVLLVTVPLWWPLARRPVWGAYGAVSVLLLLGGVDKGRLFLYLLPLAVVLAVEVVRCFDASLPRRLVAAWLGAVVVGHLYVSGWTSSLRDPDEYLARLVPTHAGDAYRAHLAVNLVLGAVVAGATYLLARSRTGRERVLMPR